LLFFNLLLDSQEIMVVSVSNLAPNGVLTMTMAKEVVLDRRSRERNKELSMSLGL
jgi:hypothetical protein